MVTKLELLSTPAPPRPPQIKHTACVLFRRYLYYMAEPEKSLWQTSNIQIKALIKQTLLNALTT